LRQEACLPAQKGQLPPRKDRLPALEALLPPQEIEAAARRGQPLACGRRVAELDRKPKARVVAVETLERRLAARRGVGERAEETKKAAVTGSLGEIVWKPGAGRAVKRRLSC